MEQRYALGPNEVKKFSTEELRKNFLMESLFVEGQIQFVYTHYDRMMIGGVNPGSATVKLETYPELRSEYFLERREIGIINVGGEGKVEADGTYFGVSKMDCLYLGKGTKNLRFSSVD
ncbi:MAG: 5-dehydro-4-deoxy-D-glucuronate isomerase, partial [Chitinophagaceae bacterium]